jgi:hypothetical protein
MFRLELLTRASWSFHAEDKMSSFAQKGPNAQPESCSVGYDKLYPGFEYMYWITLKHKNVELARVKFAGPFRMSTSRGSWSKCIC